jgi:hypothetical protein
VIIGCHFGEIILLVDVVMFSGESELLEARLDHLGADLTVVVEGDHFFQGQKKGFVFPEVEAKLKRFSDRLMYVPTESQVSPDAWSNEYHLRNRGLEVLRSLEIPDDAIVGFFDTDEIPDPVLLRQVEPMVVWNMAKFQMSLYWFQQYELTGFSGRWSLLSAKDPAQWRRQRDLLPIMIGGYHFSSFGSLDATRAKWDGFSHTELKRSNMDAWVEDCWSKGCAIESGALLTETEQLESDFPAFMLEGRGPSHWYRRRS